MLTKYCKVGMMTSNSADKKRPVRSADYSLAEDQLTRLIKERQAAQTALYLSLIRRINWCHQSNYKRFFLLVFCRLK